jgi:Lrp/AsnC family transcriptional regulator, leucine-responsive regulatory protein
MANEERKMSLDSVDRRLLEVLQREGRLSNVALAERVHLSPSPCLRRVKALEEDGVIEGYRAVLGRVVPDLRAYERLLLGSLLKLPSVADVRSNVAIRTVKAPAPLPLGHLA